MRALMHNFVVRPCHSEGPAGRHHCRMMWPSQTSGHIGRTAVVVAGGDGLKVEDGVA